MLTCALAGTKIGKEGILAFKKKRQAKTFSGR